MKKYLIILVLILVGCSASITKVPIFKGETETYSLKAEINDFVTLPFILDTGASELHIPPSIVKLLIYNDKLTINDTLEGRNYIYANGSIEYRRRFVIRELKLGEIVVKNVECVIGSDDSPLLIGQSVLSRFSKYEINNKEETITFYK